jgi:hypothetical protein
VTRSIRLATASCLAGFLLGACSSGGKQVSSPSPPPIRTSNSVAPFTEAAWKLASVSQAGDTVMISPAVHSTLKFSSDGKMVMFDDTVNTTSGKITLTDSGYVVSDAGTTLGGSTGSDPQVRLIVKAIAAVSGMGSVTDKNSTPVRISIVQNQLVLQNQGFELAFDQL